VVAVVVVASKSTVVVVLASVTGNIVRLDKVTSQSNQCKIATLRFSTYKKFQTTDLLTSAPLARQETVQNRTGFLSLLANDGKTGFSLCKLHPKIVLYA